MDEQTELSKKELDMFDNAKEGELPKLDVTKHIGVEKTIVSATPGVKQWKDKDSYYIKYETDVIETLTNGTEIRASKIVGLHRTEEGLLIWGEDTKMGVLLKKYGVAHWKDLVGIIVKVQTITGKDSNDYLTF